MSRPLDWGEIQSDSCSTMADQSTPANDTKEQERTLWLDIAAIVGFVILVVIVIWGLVHLISLGGSWIASLSGKTSPTISVTAPSSAPSGAPFTVSWKYTPPVSGSYALLYPCHDGLSFKAAAQGAGNAPTIPCGAAYTMPMTNNALVVTPVLTASNSVVTSLSILFLPNATGTAMTANQAQGSTSITITAPQVATPQTTQTAKPAAKPATGRTVITGPSDLSVSSISGSVDASGNATVSFTIANIGGSASGTYYFTAALPTQSGAYTSPMQSSLGAGDRMVNTLNFGPVQSGGVVTVTVIPSSADASAANNSASMTLTGSGYYGGSYNYVSGYQTPAYTNYYGTSYGSNVYYPNTYPYTPQPCGSYNNYPCQNQPLYYTQNSQPYYNYPYNQYQPYYYQPTYTY
jgi:hypothetical protein